VGYTAQMQADEAGTLARVQGVRDDVLAPLIARHKGRIVKLMGDGFLVERQSVVAAIACALDWQGAVAAAMAELPAERRLNFRIGVDLGDVMVEGDDIYGDGVNIASRLEALAGPGEICVSENAYRQAKGRIEARFDDLGPQALRNVAEPVRAYRLRPPGPPASMRAEARDFTHPAVAVLPFDNMSGDPEQDYFSDGLTEDIITALSQWRSFPVIARNSSFSFKGRSMRVEEIAGELGARYILEGSVRKAGRRLRISAQLIDAKTDHHVWAERYDRDAEDVFAVQDEITERIAAIVVPEIELFEHRRARTKPTEDLTAWDHYLRGMETFHDETGPGTRAALAHFSEAVALDPTYGDAWARLGWCHAKLVMHGASADRAQDLAEGFRAARRAVALDGNSPLAHIALGTVHIWAEEIDLGLAEALRAVELNPNFAHAAMAAGNRLDLVGRTEEGIREMERALALNPRDPNCWRYMAYLSRAYASLGETETAADWARRAVLLRPTLAEALFRAAVTIAHAGAEEEVRGLIARCEALEPGYTTAKADWRPYRDAARNAALLAPIRAMGLLGA